MELPCTKQVTVLYTCVVCGNAFSAKQSLMAHLKIHNDIEWKDFHVRLPKESVDKFQAVCKKHKTTTCNVILHLMNATVKGDEMGVIDLASSNPLVIQMVSFFGARPRGHGKYDFSSLLGRESLGSSDKCAFCLEKAKFVSQIEGTQIFLCHKHLLNLRSDLPFWRENL